MASEITRKCAAFRRFAEAHPRYHGGFLADCFYDVACAEMGINNISTYQRIDPNDPRWDKIAKENNNDK